MPGPIDPKAGTGFQLGPSGPRPIPGGGLRSGFDARAFEAQSQARRTEVLTDIIDTSIERAERARQRAAEEAREERLEAERDQRQEELRAQAERAARRDAELERAAAASEAQQQRRLEALGSRIDVVG